MVYRRLSIPSLLVRLGRCRVNILVVGEKNSWLINARTTHSHHFVGTRLCQGLTKKASNTDVWNRLEVFAKRHASPNA